MSNYIKRLAGPVAKSLSLSCNGVFTMLSRLNSLASICTSQCQENNSPWFYDY